MKNPLPKLALPMLLLAVVLPGCSRLTPVDPAAEAARAQSAFQAGDYRTANRRIRVALSKRDDVSEYWVLAGRIAAARGEVNVAYIAYQNALTLDRANVEALQALCQFGPSVASAAEVDRYADQLLLIQPNSPIPLSAKGIAASRRGDVDGALGYAERILAIDPQNARGLTLKAQLLVRKNRVAEAGPLLENALKTAPADAPTLLQMLARLYVLQVDRPRYVDAIVRLADKQLADADVQLGYADILFEEGKNDQAQQRVIALMRRRPNDVIMQQSIVELWLTQGPGAVPLDRLVSDGQSVSLLMRAAFGAYANAMGRPDLTRALLALDVAKNGRSPGDLDAKAVLAEAALLSRDPATARKMLDEVLAVDGRQPRALLARSRLALATGDFTAALRDARQVISNDPHYVTAQLLQVEILERRGDRELVNSALRQALDATPADPRLTRRLAVMLIAEGKGAEAANTLREAAQRAPMSRRIGAIRASLCGKTGQASCGTPITTSEVLQSI